MLTHKEMTAHIRGRIKAAGIKARVSLYTSCGYKWIRVFVPACDIEFTQDEQRTLRTIAKVNRLVLSGGQAIDTERMTDPMQMDFIYHPSRSVTLAEDAVAA